MMDPALDPIAQRDALIGFGAMRPVPTPAADPVHAIVASHFEALAALETACRDLDVDDDQAAGLGQAEHQARRALLAFVPASLAGLEAKLAYCLAFSLPAWEDSEAEDEPLVLLKTTMACLSHLVGRQAAVVS